MVGWLDSFEFPWNDVCVLILQEKLRKDGGCVTPVFLTVTLAHFSDIDPF
jgi:hypothetical protein